MSSVDVSPAMLGREGLAVAERLRGRAGQIGEELHRHLQSSVPDPTRDKNGEYQKGVRHTIAALIDYVLDGIAAEGDWQRPIPVIVTEQARSAARAGVSLSLIVRRYVAAHDRLSIHIATEADTYGFSSDVPAVRGLRTMLGTLLDHVTAAVEAEYTDEIERCGRGPSQRRALIVRRLLNGELVNAVERAELDYALESRWHIAVVAGENSGQALNEIRDGLGCELLTSVADNGPVWGWLGSQRRVPAECISDYLRPRSRVRAAIGEPRPDLDGWRLTHHEALAAWPIASHADTATTYCATVTLDAALLADSVLASLHQETYLMPLNGMRDGGRSARATLRAYFASDESVASTGVRLQVSRRTVENRLRAIETVLCRPLRTCLPEIAVALRLEALAAHNLRRPSPYESGV